MFSVFLCGLCDLFVCSGMFGRGRRSAPKVFLKEVRACWSAAPVIMLFSWSGGMKFNAQVLFVPNNSCFIVSTNRTL